MDEVRIEPTTASHVEGYHQILDQVARERRFLAAVQAPSLEQARAFVEAVTGGAGVHVVAVTEHNRVVGWCDLVRNHGEGFAHAGRLGMGVVADHRRRGIGRRLVQAVINKAPEVAINRIELEVFASNYSAIALYRSLGFAHEGVKRGARQIDAAVDDIILMALRLADDRSTLTRQDLARRIDQLSRLRGEFRLRSGAMSHEYFDKYRFESDPALLTAIADGLAALIPPGIDALAGLELGGVPVATALSIRTGLPAVFVRKQAKDYGTCRFAEGGEIAGRRLLIIEDVITSGGQVIASCNELRRAGAVVEYVVCVIDRQAGGAEALAAAGLELRSLFTKKDLDDEHRAV